MDETLDNLEVRLKRITDDLGGKISNIEVYTKDEIDRFIRNKTYIDDFLVKLETAKKELYNSGREYDRGINKNIDNISFQKLAESYLEKLKSAKNIRSAVTPVLNLGFPYIREELTELSEDTNAAVTNLLRSTLPLHLTLVSGISGIRSNKSSKHIELPEEKLQRENAELLLEIESDPEFEELPELEPEEESKTYVATDTITVLKEIINSAPESERDAVRNQIVDEILPPEIPIPESTGYTPLNEPINEKRFGKRTVTEDPNIIPALQKLRDRLYNISRLNLGVQNNTLYLNASTQIAGKIAALKDSLEKSRNGTIHQNIVKNYYENKVITDFKFINDWNKKLRAQ